MQKSWEANHKLTTLSLFFSEYMNFFTKYLRVLWILVKGRGHDLHFVLYIVDFLKSRKYFQEYKWRQWLDGEKERNQDKIEELERNDHLDRIANGTVRTKIPHLSNSRKIRRLPRNRWLWVLIPRIPSKYILKFIKCRSKDNCLVYLFYQERRKKIPIPTFSLHKFACSMLLNF